MFLSRWYPVGFLDDSIDLSQFESFGQAYHQLMLDISGLAAESIKLVISLRDDIKTIYISGGFARNELFTRLLATLFPDKKVFTSEVDNATALGCSTGYQRCA